MENPTVLITGASRGIGAATALRFAREKFSVIVCYNRPQSDAKRVARECERAGAKEVLVMKLDVSDNASIHDAVKVVQKKFGKIEILVNNAGILVTKDLQDQSFEEIESQIRTNLEGLIKVTHAFLPCVLGTVINISSGAGKQGFARHSVYSATKFGVRGFTQAMGAEYRKIRFYSVNPGTTATEMTNFAGVPPEDVAEVIYRAAIDGYGKASGSDIDVWAYI